MLHGLLNLLLNFVEILQVGFTKTKGSDLKLSYDHFRHIYLSRYYKNYNFIIFFIILAFQCFVEYMMWTILATIRIVTYNPLYMSVYLTLAAAIIMKTTQ